VVASEKQYIIRVDSVDDVEAYNNYDEKIEIVRRSRLWKKNLPKDILPWKRKGVKGRSLQQAS
jgi:hypothetical protein